MKKPILRKKEEGEIWNVFGEKIICKVTGAETFGRLSVVEEASAPKSFVPTHFHEETDEIIYVVEGEEEFQVDGQTQTAVQGEMVVIPRNTAHGFRNLLDTESKCLAIVTPSGFENFFAEISKLKTPEIEEVIEIGKRNDLQLVM